MENQDLDLIGKTVGNMPYKIGIVDKDGNLKSQFVAKASTNRIDIPQSSLGAGGSYGLPSTIKLFSGSAVGNILLVGPTSNYDNVQDGLLLTLSNRTPVVSDTSNIVAKYYNISNPQISSYCLDLSSIGLKQIKIPKEKLVVNSSFDISDQLSQYIGKEVNLQFTIYGDWTDVSNDYSFSIVSFGGTTIKVLPNTTLNMNLTVRVKDSSARVIPYDYPIPVVQVNTYKN